MFLMLSFNVVEAQGNHNYGRPEMTSVIVSSDFESFWLFIDDVQQNTQSVRSIKVEFIPTGEHYLRVEMDNRDHVTIGQYIMLSRNNNYYWVDNQRNMYGISLGRGTARTDAVVRFASVQRNPSYPSANQPLNPINPTIQFPPSTQVDVVLEPAQVNMNDTDFSQALSVIEKQSFESNKLTTAKQVVANNLLSVEQIMKICKLFSFENTKLDFAKSAYDHCIDKERYYLMNDVLEYSSSKDELDRFISSQR